MEIIKSSVKLEALTQIIKEDGSYGEGNNISNIIEKAGRTCYKSESKITNDSADKFCEMIQTRNHMSTVEHCSATFRIVCDRGVSHELVRHRLASYSQESTRYVASVDKKNLKISSEEEIVEAYQEGFTMKRIAELSNKKEWDIRKILKLNKVELRGINSRGLINHNYFENIDTPEKAYLIGLIQADGSIGRGDKSQISITQHRDYSWYIELMLKEFVQTPSIVKDRNCNQILFTSEGIKKSLLNIGIIPNKSYDQTEQHIDILWNSIPIEFKYDFLRGFLDGDGYLRFYEQNNKGKTFSVYLGFCGNYYLIKKISDFIYRELGYKTIIKQVDSIYRITITKPDIAIEFSKRMYRNFKYPFGHPAKSSRIIEVIGGEYPIASWGDKNFQVMIPTGFYSTPLGCFTFLRSIKEAEDSYRRLILLGWTPQQARAILPNCLKTEIVMTANFREWLHFLELRTSNAAHPDMQVIAKMIGKELNRICPVLFGKYK